MQTAKEQIIEMLRRKGPMSVKQLQDSLPHLNKLTVKGYVFKLQQKNMVKNTPCGWTLGKKKLQKPRLISDIDITPLKNNGWEYQQSINFTFGRWKCPIRGTWHNTADAIRIQAKRTREAKREPRHTLP